jgi:hypothetical protein
MLKVIGSEVSQTHEALPNFSTSVSFPLTRTLIKEYQTCLVSSLHLDSMSYNIRLAKSTRKQRASYSKPPRWLLSDIPL